MGSALVEEQRRIVNTGVAGGLQRDLRHVLPVAAALEHLDHGGRGHQAARHDAPTAGVHGSQGCRWRPAASRAVLASWLGAAWWEARRAHSAAAPKVCRVAVRPTGPADACSYRTTLGSSTADRRVAALDASGPEARGWEARGCSSAMQGSGSDPHLDPFWAYCMFVWFSDMGSWLAAAGVKTVLNGPIMVRNP